MDEWNKWEQAGDKTSLDQGVTTKDGLDDELTEEPNKEPIAGVAIVVHAAVQTASAAGTVSGPAVLVHKDAGQFVKKLEELGIGQHMLRASRAKSGQRSAEHNEEQTRAKATISKRWS